MSPTFNINVTGGNVSLGAASQGNRATVSGHASMNVALEAGAKEMYAQLETLAQRAATPPETQAAAAAHAKDLVDAVAAQDQPKACTILELVQKNFSWAYPALKDFAKVAWPALLAAIGS